MCGIQNGFNYFIWSLNKKKNNLFRNGRQNNLIKNFEKSYVGLQCRIQIGSCTVLKNTMKLNLKRHNFGHHRSRPRGAGGRTVPARLITDNVAAMSVSQARATVAAAGPCAWEGDLGFSLPLVPRKHACSQRGSISGRDRSSGASLCSPWAWAGGGQEARRPDFLKKERKSLTLCT